VVPEVLRKWIPGEKEFLPFIRELPKDSTSQKVKAKKPVDDATRKMDNLKV
jgi:seryl-tRNA synthetase